MKYLLLLAILTSCAPDCLPPAECQSQKDEIGALHARINYIESVAQSAYRDTYHCKSLYDELHWKFEQLKATQEKNDKTN